MEDILRPPHGSSEHSANTRAIQNVRVFGDGLIGVAVLWMSWVGYFCQLTEKFLLLVLEPALPVFKLHALNYEVFGTSFRLVALPPTADVLEAAASALELDQRTVLL